MIKEIHLEPMDIKVSVFDTPKANNLSRYTSVISVRQLQIPSIYYFNRTTPFSPPCFNQDFNLSWFNIHPRATRTL